jgi:hypothetical protein
VTDMIRDYEYYPLQIGEDHWLIFKVDTHHNKLPTKTYEIKKWAGQLHCDCPAGGRCKHLQMIQPKKDLF